MSLQTLSQKPCLLSALNTGRLHLHYANIASGEREDALWSVTPRFGSWRNRHIFTLPWGRKKSESKMTPYNERLLTRRRLFRQATLAGVGLAGLGLLGGERRLWAHPTPKTDDDTGAWEFLSDKTIGRPAAVLGDDKLEVFLRSDAPKNSLWVSQQKQANGEGGYENWNLYEGAAILRDPAAARLDNGDVWTALVNANQEIRLAQRKDGEWTKPWGKLERLDSLAVLGNPALIPAGNGGLLLAARYQSRGAAGSTTYAYFKYCNDKGVWSGWVSGSFLGTTDMVGHGQQDGSTVVFARDTKGKLAAALFKGSAYPQWQNGLSSEFTGVPGVGQYSDGRLVVFVTGGDAKDPRLFRRTQNAPNEVFKKDEDWEPEGDLPVRGTVSVASQTDKKVVVVARDASNKIAYKRQLEADGAFGEWVEIPSGDLKFNADPIVVANADGRLCVMARASDGNLYHTQQITQNGGFAKPGTTPLADPA